jgi:diguanylate cyclase (GGDEF)-like protein/PAS domain S-box-containing protein
VVTRHGALQLALYEALAEFSAALVGVGDATQIRFLSPSLGSALGWGPSGMPAPGALAFGLVHMEDRDRLTEVLRESMNGSGSVSTQVRLAHADGTYKTFDCVVRDLRDDERVGGFLVQGWDVNDREFAYQQAALYDVLTGLPNRVLFMDRLTRALRAQQRHTGHTGVIYLDLDGFKHVNDQHGHEAGDVVLQEIARRLADSVRPGDTAARLSGDEFVVLCEQLADAKTGYQVASRITQALAPPMEVNGTTVSVGCSAGLALARDPLVSPQRLLALADSDMYESKRRARRAARGL